MKAGLMIALLAFSAVLAVLSMNVTPVLAKSGGCPDASGVLSSVSGPDAVLAAHPGYALSVSYTQSGDTFTFSVTTPVTAGWGVISYCVYPTDASGNPTGTIPGGTTDNIPPPPGTCTPPANWQTGVDSTYESGVRDTGTDNIPYNGATTCALTVNWGSSTNFLIVLHVLDGTICGGGTSNPGTCHVIPNGMPRFPHPPPSSVPQFPLGMGLVLIALTPVLYFLKRKNVPIG